MPQTQHANSTRVRHGQRQTAPHLRKRCLNTEGIFEHFVPEFSFLGKPAVPLWVANRRVLGLIAQVSFPHTLTPSHPQTLTPSHPHTLTPSHPHTLTPSHPQTLTPSHPHKWHSRPLRSPLCGENIFLNHHARPFEPSITGQFWEILTTFGDKCPQNSSKNKPMAPKTNLECPHEGPSVVASSA